METPARHEGQPQGGRRAHNEEGNLRKGVKKSGELGVKKGIARLSPVSPVTASERWAELRNHMEAPGHCTRTWEFWEGKVHCLKVSPLSYG